MSPSKKLLLAAIVSITLSASAWAADEHTGRGVFNFASASGCPLKGNTDCNRLALSNDDTHAVIDTATHTIAIGNTQHYAHKTEVADLLLQGSGIAADGQRVPLSLHIHLSRDGEKWKTSMHSHAPVRGTFTQIQIDPYRITVNGADAVTPRQGADVLANPSLAARLANQFVQVSANPAGEGSADITIALGAAKLTKSVMRARFTQSSTGTAMADENGAWSLELEALSSQIPRAVTQRDLFVFQLENEKLLQTLREKGFQKHDLLTLGMRNGKGYLRFNDAQQDFPGAAATARAFLENSFIGLILIAQYAHR